MALFKYVVISSRYCLIIWLLTKAGLCQHEKTKLFSLKSPWARFLNFHLLRITALEFQIFFDDVGIVKNNNTLLTFATVVLVTHTARNRNMSPCHFLFASAMEMNSWLNNEYDFLKRPKAGSSGSSVDHPPALTLSGPF